MKRNVKWKRILIGISIILLAIMCYMTYWITNTYKPDEAAEQAIQGTSELVVTEPTNPERIEFKPKNVEPTKGFIFYPGGLVEPESYAPLCEKIAEEGYLVVVPHMTLNLAVLSANRAEEIVKEYPEITTWAIGGHSLGGVMAAKYAASHKEIAGVVLYAAYPQGDALKDSSMPVLSVYGSKDGVANLDKVKGAILPSSARFVEIKGGNHAFFGSYGMQKGDNEADITPEQQQEQAAKETVAFLEAL